MPMFDYQCTVCGDVHEALVKNDSVEEPPCSKCGASTKRIFTNGNLRFHFNWFEDFTSPKP